MAPSIGALASLTQLDLRGNDLFGVIPSIFVNLTNLERLCFAYAKISNRTPQGSAVDGLHVSRGDTQAYIVSCFRNPPLRFLNYGMAITKKRKDILSTTITTMTVTKLTNPLFTFLTTHGHYLYGLILSFLDPLHCCNKDRTALLKCWKSLGGEEDVLRQGYGDDVVR